MKRSSPLDALEELRKRSAEQQRSVLAERGETERRARADEISARDRLLAAARESQSARQVEARRLDVTGITAAEGQQRVAWEVAQRRAQAELAQRLDRAIASHRNAAEQHELAQGAVRQAEAELSLVRGRIDQQAQLTRRRDEQAQQETLDEAAARRFTQRGLEERKDA